MSASRPPAIQTGVSAAALWSPRQGNTDTATWCVLGSSARRLSAFSHRAISFHENSARDRGMSRGPRTVVSFGCAFGGRSASGRDRAMRPPRRGATVPAAPRGSRAPDIHHTAWPACPSPRSTKKKASSRSTSEAACELSGWGRSGRKDGAPRPHPLRGSAPPPFLSPCRLFL